MTACEMLACRLEVDQLEERNTGSVEVDGSIPSSSTIPPSAKPAFIFPTGLGTC